MAAADRLRRPHWVYRFFNSSGELLYIGTTVNPAQRMAGWASKSKTNPARYGWFGQVERVTWQQSPGRVEALAGEKRAIESERPAFNRNHQPVRFPYPTAVAF
jgi:excinuclease UvrABC nuclease subunit